MSHPSPTLHEIREQYPEYDDLSNKELANMLYDKYGQGMQQTYFYQEIGYTPGVKIMDNLFDVSTLLIAVWLAAALLRVAYLKSKGLYKKTENELRQHFSYRLIQVLYIGAFLLGILFIFMIGWIATLCPKGWVTGIWILATGYLSLYVILNLFREALLYLFLQKPYSWAWLLSLLNFLFFGKLKYNP